MRSFSLVPPTLSPSGPARRDEYRPIGSQPALWRVSSLADGESAVYCEHLVRDGTRRR